MKCPLASVTATSTVTTATSLLKVARPVTSCWPFFPNLEGIGAWLESPAGAVPESGFPAGLRGRATVFPVSGFGPCCSWPMRKPAVTPSAIAHRARILQDFIEHFFLIVTITDVKTLESASIHPAIAAVFSHVNLKLLASAPVLPFAVGALPVGPPP